MQIFAFPKQYEQKQLQALEWPWPEFLLHTLPEFMT